VESECVLSIVRSISGREAWLLLLSHTTLEQIQHYTHVSIHPTPYLGRKLTRHPIHQKPIPHPLHLPQSPYLLLIQNHINPRPNPCYMAHKLQPTPRQLLNNHNLNISTLDSAIIQSHLIRGLVGDNGGFEALRGAVERRNVRDRVLPESDEGEEGVAACSCGLYARRGVAGQVTDVTCGAGGDRAREKVESHWIRRNRFCASGRHFATYGAETGEGLAYLVSVGGERHGLIGSLLLLLSWLSAVG
jgi:hypothetical protein